MSQTKLISLDNLSRYDGKIKDLISSYKMAGNAIAYYECSTPNTEINITGAGYVVENTIKAENNTDLYMIRFTADAEATQTTRTFNYAQNYPVLIVRRDLPINYSDGSDFTRAIHAKDYIIIKLVYDSNIMTGGVIVADHDSTIRDDFKDAIGWDNHKNLLEIDALASRVEYGIRYVVNDGVITANGTAVSNSIVALYYSKESDLNKNYIISGCPIGGSNSTYKLQVFANDASEIIAQDIGNGASFNTSKPFSIRIVIYKGITASNLVFKPMLREATETNSTFEPYHPVIGPAVNELLSSNSRTHNDITGRLSDLSKAVAEQNLGKYGYKIGDYFTGSNYTYVLADLDTFYGGYSNYAVVNIHHIGIVVKGIGNSAYLSSGTLVGYESSTLHSFLTSTVLNNIKTDMISLFGGSTGLEHLVANKKLFNKIGSYDWSTNNEYISALTEVQVYGCPILSIDKFQQGEACLQLELFRKYRFNEILGNAWYWLRSIHTSNGACLIGADGPAVKSDGLTQYQSVCGLILFK